MTARRDPGVGQPPLGMMPMAAALAGLPQIESSMVPSCPTPEPAVAPSGLIPEASMAGFSIATDPYTVYSCETNFHADIKDILVSRNLTTSVAASEAFFSFQTNGLLHKIIAEGITRLRRWGRKIVDDATGPNQITDKYVMAILRSHFVHDLKQFLDIKEPKTVHKFEDLVKQWELTQSHKRSIYTRIGASQRYQSYTTSAQSPTRKPLTCYHRGKVGYIAKECRSKGSETPRQ